MKVVNNAGKVIEVTKTAYEILYKDRGFQIYKETKKTTSSKPKKVKNDGGLSKG